MENSNTDPNSTEGGPNTSEQSTRMINNQTTSERAERSKYKIPILSDRDTDFDEIIDEGIEYMDPHTVYHIKGDAIWALGPKVKHEIMRGQWDRELNMSTYQNY